MDYALSIAAASTLAVALTCAALNLQAVGQKFLGGCARGGAFVVGALGWLLVLRVLRVM